MGATQLIQPTVAFEEKLDHFYSTLQEDPYYEVLQTSKQVILFLSVGCKAKRADVFQVNEPSIDKAWKQVKKQAMRHTRRNLRNYEWIKIDFVEKEECLNVTEFIDTISRTKKNYYRKGISFDEHYRFAFLEQELNGNAIIQIDKQTRRGFIQERNLQQYVKQHRPSLSWFNLNQVTTIRTFTTRSFFYENEQFLRIKNTELDNGRRERTLDQEEVAHLIQTSASFLAEQVQSDGKFTYGYFSCFDKEIRFYNILRHASTLYAMAEAYELFPDNELKEAIIRGLSYLKTEGSQCFEVDGKKLAYLIDGPVPEEAEIKLGANAAAILAVTKYQEVFQDDQYLPFARMLGDGIMHMQQRNGRFNHVLHVPSLQVKESFRIIYYDGEAAFALMRLYALDRNPKWLHSVEHAFAYFIAKQHWKHHDHWLSYCTNELTKYKPERAYFEFGLNNVMDKLSFIYQRQTTYPTFLELTLAGWNMVGRLEKTEHKDLLDEVESSKIEQTFHKRAEYQRNGFFYPEVAMYFKHPGRILGSFFIRHHSFRSRIDDTEHYLSGYCAYYKLLRQREQ